MASVLDSSDGKREVPSPLPRISFNEAATWRTGRRTPKQEVASFSALCEMLERLAAKCRPLWPDFINATSGSVLPDIGLPAAIAACLSPHDVVDLLGQPRDDWPASIQVWVRAALAAKAKFDQYMSAHRDAVQALLAHARSGHIDLYARRDEATRHFALEKKELVGPYRLSADFRHLVPVTVAHSTDRSRMTHFDVEVSEAQIAWLFGETDDPKNYLTDSIRRWYVDEHVPEYTRRGKKPNREGSKAAAKAKFGDVPGLDGIMRECRRELAPTHWHRSGRAPGKR